MHFTRSRRVLVSTFCAVILTLAAVPLATSAQAVDPAPICPAATANGRFVRWIYLNILFRCPDSGGGTYWTGLLDAGFSRSDMAFTIDMSDENIFDNNVIPIFQDFYGRPPTPQEANAGAANIRAHRTDTALLSEYAASDEAYNHLMVPTGQTRDQAWLTAEYNGVLDRAPDPAGEAYFNSILGSPSTQVTRLKVAVAMEYSPENADGWVGAVYGAAFQRPPDPGGFTYWKNYLLTQGFQAFRMWTYFLSSDEAYAIAQTQPNPPPDGGAALGSRLHPASR